MGKRGHLLALEHCEGAIILDRPNYLFMRVLSWMKGVVQELSECSLPSGLPFR